MAHLSDLPEYEAAFRQSLPELGGQPSAITTTKARGVGIGWVETTGSDADHCAFRAPSLRNVALIAPSLRDPALLAQRGVAKIFNNGGNDRGLPRGLSFSGISR